MCLVLEVMPDDTTAISIDGFWMIPEVKSTTQSEVIEK